MDTAFVVTPSPVGDLLLTATERGLSRVYFERHRHMDRIDPAWVPRDRAADVSGSVLDRAAAQLGEYFAGARRAFELPLDPRGTEFQRRVWALLAAIPWGTIISYGELARRYGDVLATRAVAGANARNPVSIIVPCHRVIGADGSLTGFGGGIERKRWLLRHEGVATGEGQGELGL